MSTFTYSSEQDHKGSILLMTSSDGTTTCLSIPGDATITVQTLRSSPDPEEIYTGTSQEDVLDAVAAQLSTNAL